MSLYNIGIHIVSTTKSSVSCIVFKSSEILREEPHNTEELQKLLKSYNPELILYSYTYTSENLAHIQKLLNHINYTKSDVRIILNPLHAHNNDNIARINKKFLHFVKRTQEVEANASLEEKIQDCVQDLSHNVQHHIIKLAEQAKLMLNSDEEHTECIEFLGKLAQAKEKLNDIIVRLENLTNK